MAADAKIQFPEARRGLLPALICEVLKHKVREGDLRELFLVGAHISPYEQGNRFNHDPERPRRLLMHKREIARLDSQIREKGLTLIPLRVYFKNGRAKVQLGLCKGKHTYDKRRTIQDREMKRDLGRALKDAQKERR
ncbi:MAG: SsrA-binding protein [Planctomycetes bacterium]|nr:SsrA-binding protein [Planctomycetota bacterium]